MEIKEPNPEKAPKINFKGQTIALTRAIWHRKYPATRHSPEEPAFLEILDAWIQTDEGLWFRVKNEGIEDIINDRQAYRDAVHETLGSMADYEEDPYYQW